MLKSILASLTGFGSDKTVMETAFALARIDAGHIEALHTRIDATQVAAIAGMTKSHPYGSMHEMAHNIAQEAQVLSRSAQKAYADSRDRHLAPETADRRAEGVTASFREVTTMADETLHQARLHDLTVTARVPELAPDRLDRLVLSAGKPIIVAPARPPKSVGETVVLAWKDAPEAAKAVTAALPLLVRARRVIIVALCESMIEQDAGQAAAEGLLAQLKRHGISGELRVSTEAVTTVAEKILEIAYAVDADLIVMGAYGHSRLRELVLGGTTRDLLQDCDVAVLMVH